MCILQLGSLQSQGSIWFMDLCLFYAFREYLFRSCPFTVWCTLLIPDSHKMALIAN
uniref:Uncharacterized protein n=1 Tax=Anguilla anguilla TaxID=7936 RepID=A0A0E9SAA7_ANGAN